MYISWYHRYHMKQNHGKKLLSITLGIFLVGAALYLRFYAPIRVRVGVETTQIDKILHLISGIFFASLIEWRMARLSFRQALWLVIILFVSWKAFEILAVPGAHSYVAKHWKAWTSDCIGDAAATILGFLFYWYAAMDSPPSSKEGD